MKHIKQLISLLLSLALVLGVVPVWITASAEDVEYAVGDLIEFGSYPQSEVTDAETLAALNALELNWVSYGYYIGTGNTTDGTMVPSDYMRYADVTYGGEKYRAVTFDTYRAYYTGLTAAANFQQQNGYVTNTVYWFQYQPLQWRVLDPATGFIVCDTPIDSQAYNNYCLYDRATRARYREAEKIYYTGDYAHADIRTWLNDSFYNTAFSEEEKVNIEVTELSNKSTRSLVWGPQYAELDSEDTSDKVFLLGYSDVSNPAYGFDLSDATSCVMHPDSDYAKCQGLMIEEGSCAWLLRSTYDTHSSVTVFDAYGWLNGTDDTFFTGIGICPAIHVGDLNFRAERNIIVGTSLSLEGLIGVNVYMEPTAEVVAGGYAVITGPNDYSATRYFSDLAHYTNGYRVTATVCSPQMTDAVTVKIYNAAGELQPIFYNNTRLADDVYVTSVASYCERVFASPTATEGLRQLASTLYNYGAYAQILLEWDLSMTTDPAAIADVEAADLAQYEMETNGEPPAGFSYLGMSLVLREATSLRIYFSMSSTMPTITLDGTEIQAQPSGSYYFVELSGIASAHLDTPHVFNIGGYEITVSALSWAYNVLANRPDVVDACNVAKAIYLYNQAANVYFGV